MAISKAPDHIGISVKIVDLVGGKLPEYPFDGAVAIGHMDEFNAIEGKSRPTKKYTPVNDRDYEQIVSLGAVEYDSFEAKVLFSFGESEGINKLEAAFDKNEEIGLIIEINDAPKGGNATTIAQIIKVSKFAISGEKDGKQQADITAEKIGNPIRKVKAGA